MNDKNTIALTGDIFKAFFRAVSLVSSYCRLHIENGRLYVRTVDTANAMLIDISADTGNTGNAGVVLGLNASYIVHYVSKFIQDTDLVTVSWKVEENDKYRVLIEAGTCIIDILSEDTGCIRKDATPPTVTYRASFTTRLQQLNDFTGISEKCRILVKDNTARLITWFGDNNRIESVIGPATGEASTLYSTDCLKSIAKAFPEQNATIELSTDSVMKATLHTGQIDVMWMLAPRIEAD